MNRREKRFVTRAIQLAAKRLAGAPAQAIERIMLEEVERAVDYAEQEERGDLGAEVAAGHPPGLPQPEHLGMPDADPTSYPKDTMIPVEATGVPDPPRKGLILVPGQEGFSTAKTVGKEEPLAIWKQPKKKLPRGEFQRRWQEAISKLVGLVNLKMPATIQIVPKGASAAVAINRINTLSNVVSGNVKVVYGIPNQTGSTRSVGQHNPRVPDGVDAMRIDLVVSQTFSIEDATVNWDQRLADLKANAEEVFRPRSRSIVNHAPPPRGNELSLRDAGAYISLGADNSETLVDSAGNARIASADLQAFLKWQASQQS